MISYCNPSLGLQIIITILAWIVLVSCISSVSLLVGCSYYTAKLMPTYRSRRRYITGSLYSRPYQFVSESLDDHLSSRSKLGFYPEFNSCLHAKCLQTFSTFWSGTTHVNYCDAEYAKDQFYQLVPGLIQKADIKLDFQKNNSFEIIPFLFDLDATISMFTIKFWKQISYGSVNWGLLPFISDIKSLVGTTGDIFGNISASFDKLSKRQTLRFPAEWFTSYGNYTGKFEGSICLQGDLFALGDLPSPQNSPSILLDELGVHPDLKTVWDVIPLSFVADYFFPVGDLLESLHPRGWFRPEFRFSGSSSVKGVLTYQGLAPDCKPPAIHSYRCYYRGLGSYTLSNKPTVNPEFNAPNARQLFNTAYLARAALKK